MPMADDISHSFGPNLLDRAVHRHSAWSVNGVRERLFTAVFKRMVYAQIWEDPSVDLAALQIQRDSRIVTIASGGCNVMSYLIAQPAQIFAVDLNATHIALLNLKLAAARHLPGHVAFSRFFRLADDTSNIKAFEDILHPHLDEATRRYWEGRDQFGRRRITRFSRGFYRYGLLGRFIGLAHGLARLHGRDPRKLLKARTLAEQSQIFEAEFSPLFNRPIIKRLIGSPLSLFGLGIPPAQYDELCAGHDRASTVVHERLRRLACDFDIKQNYFAWQAFNRGYAKDPSGPVPPYLEFDAYRTVHDGAGRVSTHQINFIDFLTRQPDKSLDRFVLLDAQDWMSDNDLGWLWREMTRTARPGARVIFRTAAEETPLPGRVPNVTLAQWDYQAETSMAFHAQDRSAIYGGFHLYVLKAATA
jgi:S-adenosylmethionine-diacylglycerol 3-amino-3-carboxypropyl transferase